MSKATPDISKQKAAIYIRVSTHYQIDKDSLDVQRRELIAYAELFLGIKDYFVFEDPGYSAKNTDRPAYQSMMNRLRTGEFSHLLVWKIDRISRNLLDFASMYAELKTLGVSFVSKHENFDTSTAIGEAMLKIILVFAELERNMTSERVSAVMLSRANSGQWNGGHIPYGYDYDVESKQFSVNTYEADIVRKMYDLYEEKQSLLAVASFLNSKGIKSKKGNNWSSTTVHHILRNKFNLGTYIYNKYREGKDNSLRDESEWIIIENHHEPIVDEVQFDRVQLMLKRNSKLNTSLPRNSVNVHIFSGLIKCGECGKLMTATADKRRASGVQPSVYGCSTRRRRSGECSNKYISDLTVCSFVFNFMSNILTSRDFPTVKSSKKAMEKHLLKGKAFNSVSGISSESMDLLFETVNSDTGFFDFRPSAISSHSKEQYEIDELKNRKKKAESSMSRLMSLYLNTESGMSEKDFIIRRKELQDEIDSVDKALEKAGASASEEYDEDFIKKASYLVLVDKLLSNESIDYEKQIAILDPEIPKSFVNATISSITSLDGKITEIVFKNSISVKFLY